jgi:hypothetical protein
MQLHNLPRDKSLQTDPAIFKSSDISSQDFPAYIHTKQGNEDIFLGKYAPPPGNSIQCHIGEKIFFKRRSIKSEKYKRKRKKEKDKAKIKVERITHFQS